MRKFKLSTKLLLLGVIITACFSAVFPWIVLKIKNNMYEAKETKTRELVESTWGVLDYYAKQVKANALPLDEAQKRAKETIKNLRYDKDDYFWINDLSAKMIMHPIKAEMDGNDFTNYADPTGKRFFIEFVETCKKSGAGFVNYMWPKPGFEKPVQKVSYVKLLPEWGWIIGSGIYVDDVQKEIMQIIYIILGALAVIIMGGLFMSYWMARSITRPINHSVKYLNEAADQVVSASGQVSSASQSLAEGASEQASAIEETSSSLEEMSSMTKQNASNAGHANSIMNEAKQIVSRANESMAKLIKSMNEISKASEETSKIIKTIDEIAFQTNLLALNAAVEAARAGGAGAGFAVVADEVRNLAIRAADAAKNTASLIEDTVKKTKEGTVLVSKTNQDFEEVAQSATKAAELISEITAASQEQSQGIDQINRAVAEMDKITQHNAADAEESASASEQMNAQAEQMKVVVKELMDVVGGSANGEGNGNRPDIQMKKGLRGALAAVTTKISTGREMLPYKKGREIRPDQVIPMKKEDFKDF
jgi:methyl-accepting chemotaxis protein